jgi:LmbE family N-acetylglucosaminyl deacetylase
MVRVICFGAHPDDCEYTAGGVAAKWSAAGHAVKFVACTNGEVGHFAMAGGPLAQRRLKEVQRTAEILGITTQVLDNRDGELMPTLENRKTIIRLIREWKADIVMSHRPNDYHPDHRYTGILIQDAAYMVTVPFMCSDTPHLSKNPVFLYYEDIFQKPYPSIGDIVVDIDDTVEKKLAAFDAMDSQFFEGGCNLTAADQPKDEAGRKARRQKVRDELTQHFGSRAERFRSGLEQRYGKPHASKVKFAEAFEICEYGRRPTEEEIRALFPFFPK